MSPVGEFLFAPAKRNQKQAGGETRSASDDVTLQRLRDARLPYDSGWSAGRYAALRSPSLRSIRAAPHASALRPRSLPFLPRTPEFTGAQTRCIFLLTGAVMASAPPSSHPLPLFVPSPTASTQFETMRLVPVYSVPGAHRRPNGTIILYRGAAAMTGSRDNAYFLSAGQ